MAIKKYRMIMEVDVFIHEPSVGLEGLRARLASAMAETADKGLLLFDFDTLRVDYTYEPQS